MRALTVLKDAWRHRGTLGDGANSRALAAFLPAALEIQAAPPNPLARWVAGTLTVLVAIGIVWACLGEVNIVASAEGKIIPSARVKQIQPLEKAVVKRILVQEGDYVRQGQPLIELDRTATFADEKRLSGELQSAQLNAAVSEAMLVLLDKAVEAQDELTFRTLSLPIVSHATEKARLLHTRLLWQQWQHYRAQWQALQSTLAKTRAEQALTQEVITKLEQTLPLVTKRATTLRDLHRKRFAPETEYLQLEQERIQQRQDLAAERHRLTQLVAVEAEVQQQIKALKAQTRASHLADLTDTQRQVAALQEELAKARDLNAKRVLYAPVSGQVQALAVNTVGGVVTEAQQLMLIVPDDAKLTVEAFLENKDIGFVAEGMAAEIKVHTFPFTTYGVIEADVHLVSDDATVDKQRGLIYGMQLAMAKRTIQVNGKPVKLMPGMAVTAEVQTGKRRLIEFFLAPLLRHKKESVRER